MGHMGEVGAGPAGPELIGSVIAMDYMDGVDSDEMLLSPEDVMLEYEDYDPDYFAGFEDGMGGGGLSPFSFQEILEHCLEPTVRDGLGHVGKVIVWCVVFRILTQSHTGTTKVPSRSAHLASVV